MRASTVGRAAILSRLVLTGLILVAASSSEASEVRFFSVSSREVLLDGNLEGVGVDSLGVLRLAQRVARVGEVAEPFVFSASRHPEGWVLGTGNSGRVLLLTPEGALSTLLEADEPTIFATAVDDDGVVWAGGSPGGRLYKLADGEPEVFYDTGDTYIWAIEPDGAGGLWIGTGTEGRVHRVSPDGGGQVVYDVDDVHVRSLLVLADGRVLLGTAAEGLILMLEPDGSARTLYDSGLSEIVSFAAGPNGMCYAAAIRSEAGFLEMGTVQGNGAAEGGVTVSVLEEGAPLNQASNGTNGVRTQVLRFPCTGGVMETVWSFQDETVYDLLWAGERLWIGTGQEGKVFSLEDGDLVLEKELTERQVVGLVPDEHGPALATTNAAALYRVLAEQEQSGVYTSPVLDAGEIAEFGTLHWRGQTSGSGGVRFALRSGMSGEPDRTWSEWSAASSGVEIGLDDVASGRYLQFRLELISASPSPSVSEVTISYRQINLAPRIASLDVLDAGQVLVPNNFNPASQVFEPVSPDKDGIFTILAPEIERDSQRLKPLWKRGYRTLQWVAEDPNGDSLSYRLEFRPEADDSWFPIVEDHPDTYFSFDATVLPDGVYRFRVTASDAVGNGDDEGLETMRTSGPVAVDHTPPVLGKVVRQGSDVRFEVRDALNALRLAEYSLDGRTWQPAAPVDGLLDGLRERFELDVDTTVRLVLFRTMDSFFNLASFDLTGR